MNTLVQFFYASKLVSMENAIEISKQFQPREIKKHAFYLKEKQVSNEYFFLEAGSMRAFAFDVNGNEVTTGFYMPGQVVLEVSSFFRRMPSQENIEALETCSGYAITFDQLNALFHAIPDFREFGRSVLVKGFASLKLRMLSTITETAETRYANLLQSTPGIFQIAQLKHIASYLGVTDTSLSRIRKKFASK